MRNQKEILFRVQTTTDTEWRKAMKVIAAVEGVESVTLAGEEKNLLLVIGDGLGLSHINTLSDRLHRKVGHAELVELRTSGFLSTVHATYDELRMEINNLERIFNRAEEPSNLKLSLLRYITNNFSDELKIGHGGCGVVYKGVLPNGIMVAVKKLFNNHTIDDNMFLQEITSTMAVRHKNIVRCLGYCSHTEEKLVKIEGKIVLAQIRERLLCFEHLSNGSIENHLTDELRGLEWHTRYQIIKGCCEGLFHLHKEKHIIHMDLKPANILLDDQMVPKITDFGLSRLDDKSQTMSTERLISLGYCSPEYLHQGKMSAKSDIYSLGVVILELVTGSKEMPSISTVLRRWKHRWNKSAKHASLACKQVSKCLKLVERCMHRDPANRPNIWDIIGDLNKMDTTDEDTSDDTECHEVEDMLGIEPLDIHLPMELKKPILCSIELTNDTDHYYAFRISTTSLRPYHIHPIKDIVPPLSKRRVTITLEGLEKAPLHNQCKDEFSVQSTKIEGSLTAMNISGQWFDEVLNVVDKVNLTIVLDTPHTRDQHEYPPMHTWRNIIEEHNSG